MDIPINLVYQQHYLPTKRCRLERIRFINDTATITIPEPSAEEFPAAFIIHRTGFIAEGMKSYRDDCETVFRMYETEIRTLKGSFYEPIRVTHGAAISTVFENADYVRRILEDTKSSWLSRRVVEDDQFTEESVVVSDNRDETLAEIQKVASEFVYYDGKSWRKCGEPVYYISTFGPGMNYGGVSLCIRFQQIQQSQGNQRDYFTALQRKEAIDHAVQIARARGDTDSIDRMGEDLNIEVLLPDVVSPPPHRNKLRGLYLFVGPSGSGKTTIVNELVNRLGYVPVKPYTDRPKRNESENGYTFLTPEQFDKLPVVFAGTTFNGHRYGATKDLIDGSDVYIVDPAGVREILACYVDSDEYRPVHVIGIIAPKTCLESRMKARGDTDEAIRSRLANDKNVFSNMEEYCDVIIPTHTSEKESIVDIVKNFIDFYEGNNN